MDELVLFQVDAHMVGRGRFLAVGAEKDEVALTQLVLGYPCAVVVQHACRLARERLAEDRLVHHIDEPRAIDAALGRAAVLVTRAEPRGALAVEARVVGR